MARFGSSGAWAYLNGRDIGADLGEWTETREAVTERSDGLGASWEEHTFVGMRRGTWGLSGWYNDVANGLHDALGSATGLGNASAVLTYGVEGATEGANFVGFRGALQTNYQRSAARGELVKAAAQFSGAGEINEGYILHRLQGRAASGNTTAAAHDNGVSSTGGAVGYLQVPSLTLGALDGFVAKVLHSADNLTFTDLLTFTSATAAPFANTQVAAGSVNQYTAVHWQGASGAGFPTTAQFFVGLARR